VTAFEGRRGLQTSSTARKVELVIFDCDGVLIDSEELSASVLSGMMAEIGMPITPEIFRSDFLGRSFASATAKATERFGKPVPADFQMQYRSRLLSAMRGHLQAMPGVKVVLDAMTVPYCLATSSSPQRLAVSMEETALGPYFVEKSFTASMVENGKPAPDLMFHAARMMNAKSENCVVIEDSEMGLRSALNAGMQAWRFVGGSHLRLNRDLPSDVKPHLILDSMAAMHNAFRDIGAAK
jgi:HAD superfamily hydrolase (TIGR01509 family)